jgi:hypothetical protein
MGNQLAPPKNPRCVGECGGVVSTSTGHQHCTAHPPLSTPLAGARCSRAATAAASRRTRRATITDHDRAVLSLKAQRKKLEDRSRLVSEVGYVRCWSTQQLTTSNVRHLACLLTARCCCMCCLPLPPLSATPPCCAAHSWRSAWTRTASWRAR